MSFINTCSTLKRWRKFSIFLFTPVFTHVVFAKIMVSFISSVCYPYPINFIFLFHDVTITLLYTSCIFGWWWYSAFPIIPIIVMTIVIVVITSDSNPHAFFIISLNTGEHLISYMDRQRFLKNDCSAINP